MFAEDRNFGEGQAIVSVMIGSIVSCLTSGNILMTTRRRVEPSPEWEASLFQACRDHVRLSSVGVVRDGLFFDRFGMAFVPGDKTDLVAFDRAFERRFRLEVDDATAQLRGYLLHVVLVEIEFLSDLLVRQIEPHQIQTQDPLAQRMMVMREDRMVSSSKSLSQALQ